MLLFSNFVVFLTHFTILNDVGEFPLYYGTHAGNDETLDAYNIRKVALPLAIPAGAAAWEGVCFLGGAIVGWFWWQQTKEYLKENHYVDHDENQIIGHNNGADREEFQAHTQDGPKKCFAIIDDHKSPLGMYVTGRYRWPVDLPSFVKNSFNEQMEAPFTYYFSVKVTKEDLLKYDCLENMNPTPLVSQKVKQVLEFLCPNDVQFLDAEIQCKDELLKNTYYVLNVLAKVDAIDMKESDSYYDKEQKLEFEKIYFKTNCMENHHIARDKQEWAILLVSEELKNLFKKNKIK